MNQSNIILVGCDTCPSGRYNDGCNDCFCINNGEPVCTKKFCKNPTQPFCITNCDNIVCPILNCRRKQIKIKKPGECCETCIRNRKCNRNNCEEPTCSEGEIAIYQPGKCCKECVIGLCTDMPTCSYNIIYLYWIYNMV